MFHNNYGCIYDKGDNKMIDDLRIKNEILEEKLTHKMHQARYFKYKAKELEEIVSEKNIKSLDLY